MKNSPNLTRTPVSLAVKAALLSTAFGVTGAYAADDDLEEVMVTGSYIKRADLDSASPVTVISQDDIKLTGITDVGDLLQRLPSMSGSPIGTTTNNGGNGSVQIDLRGLGTVRTLTLVNGKRTVDGGDYQTIPAAMIDRVEILKDGASAIYGADAVAGVVNIITRQDFDGVEIELLTSDYFDMDSGAQDNLNIVAGKSFDTGGFVVGAEYITQEQAYQSDAPWDFFQDSWYIYPLGCENQVTAPYDGTPQGGCYPIGSSRIPESRLAFETQGTFMNEDGSGLVPYDGRTYNYAPVNYIQTPYERINVFADAHMDISDNVRIRGEVRTNMRTSAQELAPQPYNSPSDPAYQGVRADGVTPYSGISPDNFYLVQAATAAGLTPEPVVDARRRMVETTRRFTQDNTQIIANVTLEGEMCLWGEEELSWNIYGNRGHQNQIFEDFGQFYGPNLANAFGPSADLDGDGSPECYGDVADPSTLISGCVPFNMFGGAGSVTQEMIDYVGVDLVDSFSADQMQVGGVVAGNLPFSLGSDPLGFAVGYEYRWEDFTFTPDSAKQQDQVTGNTGAGTAGGYHVNSAFVEFLAPVFDNGAQSLDLKLGARYDDFSTFGDDTTFQAGVEFQVLESLKLRATYGDVFRAPNIGELFAGVVDSFPTYLDPCTVPGTLNCPGTSVQLDSQVLARVGGNPDLKAEVGDTITAGVVFTPTLGSGDLSVTVDYWKTELDDVISALGVNFILNDCHGNGNLNACALIDRRADFSVASISDAALNIASATAEGVDIEVKYGFDTAMGEWDLEFLWAHMLDRSRTAFPGDPVEQLEGRFNGSAFAEDKINYKAAWTKGDFRISYLGEYISDLAADVQFFPADSHEVEAQLYHDLIFSYNLSTTNTNITLGVTNLTDEEPPFIDSGFNAKTDPSTYRLFGRGYYLRLNQQF